MNKLIALAVATVLTALAPAADATVTWTFIETSCTAQFGPCPARTSSVTLPFAGLATLTLPYRRAMAGCGRWGSRRLLIASPRWWSNGISNR